MRVFYNPRQLIFEIWRQCTGRGVFILVFSQLITERFIFLCNFLNKVPQLEQFLPLLRYGLLKLAIAAFQQLIFFFEIANLSLKTFQSEHKSFQFCYHAGRRDR